MNKEHWLTVALDGSTNENNLKFLLSVERNEKIDDSNLVVI